MNLQEFINGHNGVGVDFDGYYGFQCVDLAQEYNKDVVGGSPFSGNAKDIRYNFDHSKYRWVDNTPSNVPSAGDIVIWGTSVGAYGHIAIFCNGDVRSFVSFDQNWPVGSKAHYQSHDYRGVMGWLTPIAKPVVSGTRTVTVTVDELNVRSKATTYGNVPIVSKTLHRGDTITVYTGEIVGSDGNIWLHTSVSGLYIWKGGTNA